MSDARLKTVETELLGMRRGHDIEGWQIPGLYLEMLRGGAVEPIREIVRHNHEDVRSLARLLAHAERHLGAPSERRSAPAGDLFGLALAFRRTGREEDALDCLDAALEGPPPAAGPAADRSRSRAGPLRRSWTAILTTRADGPVGPGGGPPRLDLIVERARILRRLGRHREALEAWQDVARAGGPLAALAWIEVAKCLEHRERDPRGALDACAAADRLAQRSRLLGRPLRMVEADLGRRRRRLGHRLARGPAPAAASWSSAAQLRPVTREPAALRPRRYKPPVRRGRGPAGSVDRGEPVADRRPGRDGIGQPPAADPTGRTASNPTRSPAANPTGRPRRTNGRQRATATTARTIV